MALTQRQPETLVFSGDPAIDDPQRVVQAIRKRLNATGVVYGQLAFVSDPKAVDIAFAAGVDKRLLHGLVLPSGGTPAGWLIVDVDAATSVFRSAWDDRSITLQSSANCTARVWVFP